jgi:hypothetical protein
MRLITFHTAKDMIDNLQGLFARSPPDFLIVLGSKLETAAVFFVSTGAGKSVLRCLSVQIHLRRRMMNRNT